MRAVAGYEAGDDIEEYAIGEWLAGFAHAIEQESDWQAIDSNCGDPPTLAPATTATLEVWGNLIPIQVTGTVSREHSVWTLEADWTADLQKVEYCGGKQIVTYKVHYVS
jgi:hypothetical protein